MRVKKEKVEKTKLMKVTITLTLMVSIRTPKRCRDMTTWIKMQKKRVKKSKVVKEEVTPKRKE
jgi:hypothetical protein